MTEKELVEMILRGNVEAFEPLVRPYRQPLLGLARRMVPDMEDAREAAQETLLRAFRYIRRYDPDRSFRNWLFGILVNEARKVRAARAAAPLSFSRLLASASGHEVAPEPASNEPAPDERYARNETRSQLAECLEVLSPREREVFLLRDIEELSVRDAAGILGATSVSVRVHLSRARRKMKKAILERYPHLGEEGR
ncbi:MAG TPA: RNA polymerase sigma factor [Acidobacteriota bacterium]|nr:RNA polymerase sigma factor [Acidobacteriota bacterium]